MRTPRLAALAVAALTTAALAAPAAASAASTISVAADPNGGNHDLTISVLVDADPAGKPKAQTDTLTEVLPGEFVDQLSQFGTCDASKLDNTDGPTAANCPDRSSIVGVGRVAARESSGTNFTSDQGYIVHTGENKLAFWWHETRAGGAGQRSGVIPATVSKGAAPFGPVVAFDTTTLPTGALLQRLDLNYLRGSNGIAPFAATSCGGGGWTFGAQLGYAGTTPPDEQVTTTAPCGPAAPPPTPVQAPEPSKLQLARATIYRADRRISILAPITARASGDVDMDLYAAGRHHDWKAPVDSQNGRVRDTESIPSPQADLGTGILTIHYPGDPDTRPQTVRLRAANTKAFLDADRPTIENGHLKDQGTISSKARGVVRVQLEYYSNGQTTTLEHYARISGGQWSLDVPLTAEQQDAIAHRSGTVHSYILFTGYFPERMRGEMQSYQVLGQP